MARRDHPDAHFGVRSDRFRRRWGSHMEIRAAKPPFAAGPAKTFVMSSPGFSITLLGATLASRHDFGRSATIGPRFSYDFNNLEGDW